MQRKLPPLEILLSDASFKQFDDTTKSFFAFLICVIVHTKIDLSYEESPRSCSFSFLADEFVEGVLEILPEDIFSIKTELSIEKETSLESKITDNKRKYYVVKVNHKELTAWVSSTFLRTTSNMPVIAMREKQLFGNPEFYPFPESEEEYNLLLSCGLEIITRHTYENGNVGFYHKLCISSPERLGLTLLKILIESRTKKIHDKLKDSLANKLLPPLIDLIVSWAVPSFKEIETRTGISLEELKPIEEPLDEEEERLLRDIQIQVNALTSEVQQSGSNSPLKRAEIEYLNNIIAYKTQHPIENFRTAIEYAEFKSSYVPNYLESDGFSRYGSLISTFRIYNPVFSQLLRERKENKENQNRVRSATTKKALGGASIGASIGGCLGYYTSQNLLLYTCAGAAGMLLIIFILSPLLMRAWSAISHRFTLFQPAYNGNITPHRLEYFNDHLPRYRF